MNIEGPQYNDSQSKDTQKWAKLGDLPGSIKAPDLGAGGFGEKFNSNPEGEEKVTNSFRGFKQIIEEIKSELGLNTEIIAKKVGYNLQIESHGRTTLFNEKFMFTNALYTKNLKEAIILANTINFLTENFKGKEGFFELDRDMNINAPADLSIDFDSRSNFLEKSTNGVISSINSGLRDTKAITSDMLKNNLKSLYQHPKKLDALCDFLNQRI